jgi:hypothetical protein
MKLSRKQGQARARFSGGRKFYKTPLWRGGAKIGTPLKRPSASVRKKLAKKHRELNRSYHELILLEKIG